jgi:uncharacterized protein
MSLVVNLRHLAKHSLALQGELPARGLDIDTRDEVIRVAQPLRYDAEVQKLDKSLLLRGALRLTLDCRCVRCLKPFQHPLVLEDWTCHVPLDGEDAAPVLNDCVDLTPYLREDILLELPRHPLCDPECRGLPRASGVKAKKRGAGLTGKGSSAWAELDKLEL